MRVHEWPDRGVRRRAILALGEIDLDTASLKPLRTGVEVVGSSSDHLVLDVTEARPPVRLGEELEFDTLYPAVSTGWSSTVTTKVVLPMRESAAGRLTGFRERRDGLAAPRERAPRRPFPRRVRAYEARACRSSPTFATSAARPATTSPPSSKARGSASSAAARSRALSSRVLDPPACQRS